MKDDMAIDAGWTAQELSLLGSAELDTPPEGAMERTLAALGAGAVVGASGAALGAAASTSKASGAWLKWLLTSALVGGAAVGALTIAFSSPKPATVSLNRAESPAVAAEKVAAVPNAALPIAPGIEAAATPSAMRLTSPPASAAAVTPSPNAGAVRVAKATLSEEIRAIDEARGLLRSGNPRGALSALARYDALVRGRGSMTAEATVVRIEALRATGDSAGASALGQRFVSQNPRSPYAEHVRQMLALPH